MGENDRGAWNWADLSDALVSYLGYKHSPMPLADWDAVVDRVGLERAHSIELVMLGVLADLRTQQPDWHGATLYEGSQWAVRQLKTKYPGLRDPASKALVWLFSHENR